MDQSKIEAVTIRNIGLRIAYFRKLREMTQGELATEVGINPNYLSHIESGSANKVLSLPLLIRIAQKLGVELARLVDFSDADSSERQALAQFEEMRTMFEEMKHMNKELDRLIAEWTTSTATRQIGGITC